jgi:hypothetical protein
VVEKQRWACQSVVVVNSNFKNPLKEIKTKTLQVGIKLAWPLLGFVGFQKVSSYMPLKVVCFLSSGITRWMSLELMR